MSVPRMKALSLLALVALACAVHAELEIPEIREPTTRPKVRQCWSCCDCAWILGMNQAQLLQPFPEVPRPKIPAPRCYPAPA